MLKAKGASKVRILSKKKAELKKISKNKISFNKGSSNLKTSKRKPVFEKIKEKLIQQKRTILAEAGIAMNSLPEQTVFPDMGDQASAECERNFMLRLRSREQRLLKKIEEAIERIDNGTFGICEVCSSPIELKRLEARPVTTMCIDCKTEQEEEEKTLRQ